MFGLQRLHTHFACEVLQAQARTYVARSNSCVRAYDVWMHICTYVGTYLPTYVHRLNVQTYVHGPTAYVTRFTAR